MSHSSKPRIVGTAVLTFTLLLAGCASGNEDDPSTGSGSPIALSAVDRLDSYTLADEEFGTMVTVTVEGDTRTIETNALFPALLGP